MNSEPQPRASFNAAERDPISDPEPAAPPLPEPDPGVFHHELGKPATPPPATQAPEKDRA